MRSLEQARARVLRDRAGLRRGGMNFHYENMGRRLDSLGFRPLSFTDDGTADLDPNPIFDWRRIYGTAPEGG